MGLGCVSVCVFWLSWYVLFSVLRTCHVLDRHLFSYLKCYLMDKCGLREGVFLACSWRSFSLSINLLIMFTINRKMLINHQFPRPQSDQLTKNRPKPKDSLFSIINDKGKQQIFTSKKLEPANQLSKWLLIFFRTYWSTHHCSSSVVEDDGRHPHVAITLLSFLVSFSFS